MNLARSTDYAIARQDLAGAALIDRIAGIGPEFPAYGHRRVTAQLRHDGLVVNHKWGMRIMREQGLSVRPRHCFVITTDSLAQEELRGAALPRHNCGTQPTRRAGPFPS
jgi:putative transposase